MLAKNEVNKDYNLSENLNMCVDWIPEKLKYYDYNIRYFDFEVIKTGEYFYSTDYIYLYKGSDSSTIIHEIGHRVWNKVLIYYPKIKDEWKNIHKNYNNTLTDYSDKDYLEDFAETFECWYSIQGNDYSYAKNNILMHTYNCKETLFNVSKERYYFMQKYEHKWLRGD